jgi:ribA/ribD-fused uncharacterized protein
MIRNARLPGIAKRLGDSRIGSKWISKKSLFKKDPGLLRPDWDDAKEDVMKKAVDAKFGSNLQLQKRLLATGTALLVEDSPYDYYWGAGEDGTGKNLLGEILMDGRSKIKKGDRS